MDDPMSGIRAAREHLEETEKEAARMVAFSRLYLGLQILEAREAGVPQKDIATLLSLTREQVRRLSVAARDADPAAVEHARALFKLRTRERQVQSPILLLAPEPPNGL
ncbi:hypothetical protein [Microbispora rosea]|uniref:hypothetical protein n=1 Tax=Microbispora rosea TaxID=58117 RepID=UPI0037A7D39A